MMKLPPFLLSIGILMGLVSAALRGAEPETKEAPKDAKDAGVIYHDAKHGFRLTLPAGVMRTEAGGVVTYTGFSVPKETNLTEKSLVIAHGKSEWAEKAAANWDARFEWRRVTDNYQSVLNHLKTEPGSKLDPNYEIIPYRRGGVKPAAGQPEEEVIVAKDAFVRGDRVADAVLQPPDPFGDYGVLITFDAEGAKQFENLTALMAHEQRNLENHPLFAILKRGSAILLTGLTQEAAEQGGVKGGQTVVSGSFTKAQAKDLVWALTKTKIMSDGAEFRGEIIYDGSAGHIDLHVIFTWRDADEPVHLDFVLRSANLRSYDPGSRPKEYDWMEQLKIASEIVRTFRREK